MANFFGFIAGLASDLLPYYVYATYLTIQKFII